MADRISSIKRVIEVAFSSVAAPARGGLRGRDFMRADLTFGADRAEY